MNHEKKKSSTTKIDKILKDRKMEEEEILYYTVGDEKISISVKPLLPIQNIIQFVSDVVDNVFIEVDGNIIYAPYYQDIATVHAILIHYTNLESNLDIEKLSAFSRTDIYKRICNKIDPTQYNLLKSSITKSIEYRKQEILSSQKKLLDNNMKKLESLINLFEKISEQFKDLNIDDVTLLIEKILNQNENGLAQAIQSFKTDTANAANEKSQILPNG